MKRSPLQRHSPLKRGQPLSRSSRLPRVSQKRKAENAEYEKRRVKFLKENPWCRVCRDLGMSHGTLTISLPGMAAQIPLSVPATEVHHMGRKYGKWLLDTRFFLPTCRPHHDFIEAHGDWARAHHYLLTQEEIRKITEL